MQAPKHTRLGTYLKSARELGPLAAGAARLGELQRIYGELAPPDLARGSQVYGSQSGKLILRADNGAIASKLRQLAPSLTSGFCSRGAQVTELVIKVQPRSAISEAAAAQPQRALGVRSLRAIGTLAGNLGPDDPLRRSLERLLENAHHRG
jgi:hypothetical protein